MLNLRDFTDSLPDRLPRLLRDAQVDIRRDAIADLGRFDYGGVARDDAQFFQSAHPGIHAGPGYVHLVGERPHRQSSVGAQGADDGAISVVELWVSFRCGRWRDAVGHMAHHRSMTDRCPTAGHLSSGTTVNTCAESRWGRASGQSLPKIQNPLRIGDRWLVRADNWLSSSTT